MAMRSFNFKGIKRNVPFNRTVFDRERLRHEAAEKRDALKRTFTRQRDALKGVSWSGPGHGAALNRAHKTAVAGVATLGAAALAVSLVPQDSDGRPSDPAPASYSVSSIKDHDDHGGQATAKSKHKDGDGSKRAGQKSSRSESRKVIYPDNLDGWIREALAIMKKHDIPGSYEGLYRNIMRESSGNPNAINTWDINARNGVPSKGLLQVIPPTFKAYHVPGTSWNIYDPVANITAAANYAADRYGSMDNVNSAY